MNNSHNNKLFFFLEIINYIYVQIMDVKTDKIRNLK